MLFIFSLAVTVLFSFIAAKMLRKHPWPFYISTILLCTALAFIPKETTGFFNDYILNMFRRGTIGTALFCCDVYGDIEKRIKGNENFDADCGQSWLLLCVCATISFWKNILYHDVYKAGMLCPQYSWQQV